MQLTLVAHYGAKPPELRGRLEALCGQLESCFPGAFEPYPLENIHGTIVGLEGRRDGPHVHNANYLTLRNETRPMKLDVVLSVLETRGFLPMMVQLGGYAAAADHGFFSRGRSPYERSFAFQGQTAVAMGWPRCGSRYPPVLDRLRRLMNEANVLHKYHGTPHAVDNDFFFVLGVLRAPVAPELVRRSERRLRRWLAAQQPVPVCIGRRSLSIVAYHDPKLPAATSRCFSLERAGDDLDELLRLYP